MYKGPYYETDLSYVAAPCSPQLVFFFINFAPQHQTAPSREITLWPQKRRSFVTETIVSYFLRLCEVLVITTSTTANFWNICRNYIKFLDSLRALIQLPRASKDLLIWAPSTILLPLLWVAAALSLILPSLSGKASPLEPRKLRKCWQFQLGMWSLQIG